MELSPPLQFKIRQKISVDELSLATLGYHDLFDYPLTREELFKWRIGKDNRVKTDKWRLVMQKNGFFFLDGKSGLITKRLMREKISKRKLFLAQRAAKVLAAIPSIEMVGITGSLAMMNAMPESDIDLMIITKRGSLWTTRVMAFLKLRRAGIPVRRARVSDEKDKLCMNIWLDEGALAWEKRNLYTAHEIAQIIPLVNKNQMHERFISENGWTKDYWPNAAQTKKYILKSKTKKNESISNKAIRAVEPFARAVQLRHMKGKITNETISSTRALFHPVDWGKEIASRLDK